MSKSIMTIPRSEYDERIKKVQAMMAEEGYDIVVTHACGCESATVRWLTNFWAVFDFVGVIIPKKGAPILLTGGPESYDFAVQFAGRVIKPPLLSAVSGIFFKAPCTVQVDPVFSHELRFRMLLSRNH